MSYLEGMNRNKGGRPRKDGKRSVGRPIKHTGYRELSPDALHGVDLVPEWDKYQHIKVSSVEESLHSLYSNPTFIERVMKIKLREEPRNRVPLIL